MYDKSNPDPSQSGMWGELEIQLDSLTVSV